MHEAFPQAVAGQWERLSTKGQVHEWGCSNFPNQQQRIYDKWSGTGDTYNWSTTTNYQDIHDSFKIEWRAVKYTTGSQTTTGSLPKYSYLDGGLAAAYMGACCIACMQQATEGLQQLQA